MLACSGTYVKELGKRQTRFWSQIDARGLKSLLYLPCSKQLRGAVLITTPWLIAHDYTRTYVRYIRYINIYTINLCYWTFICNSIQKFKCLIHVNSTCCHHESSCQIVAFGPVPANRMQVGCSRIHSWPLSINSTSSKKNKNENRQKWQQNTINSFGHLNFPT